MVEPRPRAGRPAGPPGARRTGSGTASTRSAASPRAEAHALVDTTGTRWEGDLRGPRHRRRLRPSSRDRGRGAAPAPGPPPDAADGAVRRHAHDVARRRRLPALLPGLRVGGASTGSGAAVPRGGRAPPAAAAGPAPRRRADHRGHARLRGAVRLRAVRGSDHRAPRAGRADPRRGPPARAAPLGGRLRAVRRRRRVPARGGGAGRVAGDGTGRAGHDVRAGHRGRHPAGGGRAGWPHDRALLAGLPRYGRHDRARRRRRRSGVHHRPRRRRHRGGEPALRRGPRSSCARRWAGPRRTCSPGCSTRTRRGRPPPPSPPPTRRSSPAGDVSEIPGALQVLRDLRAAGVQVCLTTGFAPSTRDALLDALGWGARGRPGPLAGRRRPGPPGARHDPGRHGPPRRGRPAARWRWWGTPSATSRRDTPPAPGR